MHTAVVEKHRQWQNLAFILIRYSLNCKIQKQMPHKRRNKKTLALRRGIVVSSPFLRLLSLLERHRIQALLAAKVDNVSPRGEPGKQQLSGLSMKDSRCDISNTLND
jgi:hypothetical protein